MRLQDPQGVALGSVCCRPFGVSAPTLWVGGRLKACDPLAQGNALGSRGYGRVLAGRNPSVLLRLPGRAS